MSPIEKKQCLMEILSKRKRWEAGGKKKYGYGKDEQSDWDFYHENLYYDSVWDYWRFDIQVYDGPEHDCWWYGNCQFLNGDTDVQIMEEGSRWR